MRGVISNLEGNGDAYPQTSLRERVFEGQYIPTGNVGVKGAPQEIWVLTVKFWGTGAVIF